MRAVTVLAWVPLAASACGAAFSDPADRIASRPDSVRSIPLGVFLGSGAEGVRRIPAFEEWLGTSVTVGHTYLPGDSWTAIEGDEEILEPWTAWRAAARNRMLVLSVPMMAPNEAELPDGVVSALLRGGAAGAFDHHFSRLAERLVTAGAADTIIAPGWEMNGVTYNSRCAPNPAMWKIYWRRIVTTMRAVPGAAFKFDFTVSRGRDAVAWPDCYPGDDVVDIIGIDSYDQPRGREFAHMISEPYGLQAHADFAKAHGKPMSFPEWGLFRNGDNPGYVRGMLDWMRGRDVVYQTITDYCPHGVWRCSYNPLSAEVYRSMLTGASPRPTPEPTTPSTPPTPSPSGFSPPAPPNPPPCPVVSTAPDPAIRPETPAPAPQPVPAPTSPPPLPATEAKCPPV